MFETLNNASDNLQFTAYNSEIEHSRTSSHLLQDVSQTCVVMSAVCVTLTVTSTSYRTVY